MIIGHLKQRNFLKKIIENSSLSHGYLFAGPDFLGKKTLVLEFLENNFKLKQGQPDLLIVKPQKDEIYVSQIRQITEFLGLKPYSAKYKAVVIDEADKMNGEAQNCLLKTLEEPKGDSILFLISSKPAMLFGTIRSRVQRFDFSNLSDKEMRNYFKGKVNRDVFEKFIFLSDGKPGKAIEFLKDPEKFNFYLEILANFPKLINSNAGPRFKFLKEKVQGREDEFLAIFLKYLRLILLDSSDPQGRMKMNEVHRLSSVGQFDPVKIKKIIEFAQEIKFLIAETNINKNLALETLFLF